MNDTTNTFLHKLSTTLANLAEEANNLGDIESDDTERWIMRDLAGRLKELSEELLAH